MKKLLMRYIDPLQWIDQGSAWSRAFIRFISVFPYLETSNAVARIFTELLSPHKKELPVLFRPLFVVAWVSPSLLRLVMKLGILLFASRFIAGNGNKEILETVSTYRAKGYQVNLDILGEAVISEQDAERYQSLYLSLIKEMTPHFPRGGLSISLKPSAFYSQAVAAAPEYAAEKIVQKITPIMEALVACGGHAFLDAEGYEQQEINLAVFLKLHRQFGDAVRFVLQAYLKDSRAILDNLLFESQKAMIRVVRGAYWDHECFRAEVLGWDTPPVFTEKAATDNNYESLVLRGLRSGLGIIPATHNVESIMRTETAARELGRWPSEYQFLYGIGEPFAEVLLSKHIPVRFYMPVLYPKGNLTEAMAYLARRISESQMSFVMRTSTPEFKESLAKLRQCPERRAS